jgi:hypothetical protein
VVSILSISRLILKEIFHRKLNFGLGLLSVTTAVACLAGSLALVNLHDARVRAILEQKKAETGQMMQAMEEDVKGAMRKLGFNIVILPKDQNLSDWYADDYGARYMPEQYLDRLAQSQIVTVEHLVPRIRQKVKWPETKWAVILEGVSAEAVNPSVQSGELAFTTIPRGEVVLGSEVHQGLGLNVGDRIQFLGRQFVVCGCRKESGTEEDVTVSVNLLDAQELLGKRGSINEILALECRSSWANLPKIRAEITRILPDTQVVEKASNVLAKMHAYLQVEKEAKAAIERERQNMTRLKATWVRFALILGSLVTLICIVWLTFLAAGNVRGRQSEIGILRTLGFRSREILCIFLARATTMGLLGGLLGFWAGGFLANNWLRSVGENNHWWIFNFRLLGFSVFVAVAITMAASWVPATRAARLDPAVALREQ